MKRVISVGKGGNPAILAVPRPSGLKNFAIFIGALAQLVERFNGIEEVSGSIPLRSTIFQASPKNW